MESHVETKVTKNKKLLMCIREKRRVTVKEGKKGLINRLKKAKLERFCKFKIVEN